MSLPNLVIIYSGTELTANLLKVELEKSGIASYIRNDFNSGLMAGFSGGTPSVVDLCVEEKDVAQAEPIVNEFIEINKD
ncbi:MAG: DUF2007 domain-containing protein [Verrucomicrobia bacterium]|nr:DUF2007 domain-containing protein [Prolixibacteraceae bacterium]